MSKPSSTQSLADSAMAKLEQAMDRNSTLAAAATLPPPAPAVSPTPPASMPPLPVRAQHPRRLVRHTLRTSGLRFTAQDHDRINRTINQALSMGERVPMSDAVRLALQAYDPRTLTHEQLAALRAANGRMTRQTMGQ